MPPHSNHSEQSEPLLQSDNRLQNSYDAIPTTSRDSELDSSNALNQPTQARERSRAELIQVLIPLSIGIFLSSMDGTVIVSAYASIGSEFNQLQNTSWIATAYMLTLTAFQPLYGKLSDMFGRKQCLLLAYFIFALGNLFCGVARDMTELILARGFTGIGGGGMATVVSIIMSDIVPLRSRGTWQGVINMVWACGSATGAPLGGFLVDSIGWRWAFYIQVPALVLAFITVTFVLDLPVPSDTQPWTSKIRRIDFGGAFAMLIAIFSLLFALDRGGNVAWHDTLTLVSLGAFVAFFALFAVVETRWAKEPFAPARIMAGKHLFPSYLCNFFGIASGLALIFYVSLYLQVVSRKTAHEVGLYIIPSVFAGLAGSLGGGLIIQSTGDFYWITVIGECTLLFGNIVVLCMIGLVTHSIVGFMIGFLLGCFGNSIGITTTLISLIANAGPEDQAMATAISYLYRSLGSVVGLSVGSTLIQQTLRSSLHKTLAGRDDIETIITRVRESLTYVDELDTFTRTAVLSSYERAIYIAFCFTTCMGACAAISSFFVKAKSLQKSGAPGNGA